MNDFTLTEYFEVSPPPDNAQPPQWKEAPHEVAPRRNEPLFDMEEASVAEFLAKPPPARRWILKDLLPQNIVGILAGGGGAGKSMLILQLAIAITTGRPFLGVEIGEPGSVLILAAEDDREELHRRPQRPRTGRGLILSGVAPGTFLVEAAIAVAVSCFLTSLAWPGSIDDAQLRSSPATHFLPGRVTSG